MREVIEKNVDGQIMEIYGLPFFRTDATESLADGINIRGGGGGWHSVWSWERLDNALATGG